MADNKKIQYTDLIEKDAITTLISQLEKVEKQMLDVAKAAKKIVEESATLAKQTPAQGYDNLQQVQQEVDKVTKAVEMLREAEKKMMQANKQKQAMERKLAELRKQDIKERAALRLAITEEAKLLRQQKKDAEIAGNAYKQLTKNVNELQAEAKRLAADQGINSKAAKEAAKAFDEEDAKLRAINERMRDGRRDVGRYRIATEKLGKSMKALAAIGIITLLAKIGEFFQSNSEGGAALEKVFGRLTVSISVFVKRAVTLIPLVTQSFNNFALSIRIAVKEVQKFGTELPAVMGGSEEKTKALTAEIKALEGQIKDGGITIDAMTKAFEGMGDEIDKLIDKNDKLIDKTLENRKAILLLQEASARLLVEREKLQAAADDDTASLQSQIEAREELMVVEQQLADIEQDIAQRLFEQAQENAKIRGGEVSAREAEAQAFVALEEAKANAEAVRLDNTRRGRKSEIDQLEADLDILLDISDKRKMINERIVLDETKTFEERAKAVKKANTDIEDSFREQIKLLEEQQGVSVDIDKIIAEEDTIALNEYVKSLGLAERPQNRLREIIIERLQATRDLDEAQTDLNKANAEGLDLSIDIIAQEEALQALQISGIDLNRVLEILQEKRVSNEIANLEFRLSKAKEGSEEFLKIQKELNDKLLAQAKTQADKEAKIEEEKQAKRIATTEAALEFIGNLSSEIQERRLASIDKAIEDSAKRESDLVELAKQGSEQAVQTLEFERKRQAKLALAREKEIERQARKELELAGIKVFTESVASGDSVQEALSKTATALVALPAIVKALPAFKDGTADTGKGGDMDSYGGFLAVLHPHEMVIPKEANDMIPKSMTPMEVAVSARESVMQKKSAPNLDNRIIAQKLDEVKSAINNKPVMTGSAFDGHSQSITETYERKGRLERRHRKLGLNG